MIDIFNSLVPEDYKTTRKLYMHYLKTLKDKQYKVSLPERSCFEIQILKQNNLFYVAIHQDYKTLTVKIGYSAIEKLLESKAQNEPNENELFLLDLRF
jgi:hypothetical protein